MDSYVLNLSLLFLLPNERHGVQTEYFSLVLSSRCALLSGVQLCSRLLSEVEFDRRLKQRSSGY